MPLVGVADELRREIGGHTKLVVTGQSWPDDSIVRDIIGDTSVDGQGDLRFNLELRKSGWSFDLNYQLAALAGDSIELGNSLPPGPFNPGLPNDDRRLFNLTDTVTSNADSAIVHRLDRLWVGYTSEKTVVRFGRQALSWGNGLFYAPMDLVNPIDPSTIDTEYKSGDDMLYLQYLTDSGADLQGAYVFRRKLLTGDVDEDEATIAGKYHGFVGEGEFDLLAARHYGDTVVGIGASRGVGGAQVAADVVVTRTDLDTYLQLSANINYSWTKFGKNMTGAVEYHFNGFGQRGGRYDPDSLAQNPDLVTKIVRGESFTLGRHYLAGAVQIELTPLWVLAPTLLANIEDPSGLLQVSTNYGLSDNMTLVGSINLPLGKNGSEFGGIETGLPGRYFSSGPGIYAQLAWYW